MNNSIPNDTFKTIMNRKSIRAFQDRPIHTDVKKQIISAALRSPTAGNMMLYSIIEVADQGKKETLVKSCDNQPFIAKAPLVLLFLADMERWNDYFSCCDVQELCQKRDAPYRTPVEGDLFIAVCDALIAAQTAVIAAESLGVGSCYIGDILENYEIHRKLFNLPRYVLPITLLCLGYPTEQQKNREISSRFEEKYILFKDTYHHLNENDFAEMYKPMQNKHFASGNYIKGAGNIGQHYYLRKVSSEFSLERNRSVREMLKNWSQENS